MKQITDEQIKEEAKVFRINENDEHAYCGFIEGAQWAISQMQEQWVEVSEIEKLIELQEKSSARYKACFGEQNPTGHQAFDLFASQLRKLLPEPPRKEVEQNG